MKKVALLISLVVVSAVAGGSFAYGWHSVMKETARPVPSVPAKDAIDSTSSLSTDITSEETRTQTLRSQQTAGPSITPSEQPIEQQLSNLTHHDNGQISVALDESQLNQLVNDAILSQPQAAQILAKAKSLETTLSGNLIETGAVLNLAELPRDALPNDVQIGLDQLTGVAPMLTKRDIYIGIAARPQVQDGKVNLKQDISLKLGQFTFPLAAVEEYIGFSTDTVEHRLNDLLNQKGLTLEAIEILDQKLVITGIRS